MTQTLTLNIDNIAITLPETHLIITQKEFQDLKAKSIEGQYLTLNDVLKLLSVSRPWFLEHVLYKPTIRKAIDIDQNPEGFVKYPTNQGGRYYFLASKTKAYFETNFAEIVKVW